MGVFTNIFSKLNNLNNKNTVAALEGTKIPHSVEVAYSIYLQDRLKQIKGSMIRLQIVPEGKARPMYTNSNITIVNENRGTGVCVIDSNRYMYGFLSQYALGKTGYKVGDFVNCIVTRDENGYVKLWIQKTLEMQMKEKEADDKKFGFNLTGKNVKITITEKVTLYGCSVKALPPKEGSKAKPVIAIYTSDNVEICEINGRCNSYTDIELWIDKTLKSVTIMEKESNIEDNEKYYRFWIVPL
ncbi:MAG: hypothetical protein NC092_04485 [Butyrivibrio sp.]|nr:hypothetical protein [Muribaculum sp.]MCM1551933.1 hypothetical protein [Butyrivibrio sp.]